MYKRVMLLIASIMMLFKKLTRSKASIRGKPFRVQLNKEELGESELSHQSFSFGLELGAIDKEKKKVSFTVSNETIVSRGWYDLQLLHGEENVSLDRADILKLFFNHKTENFALGKWQKMRIENRELKGEAVFDSEDEKAMEAFGKIERGFLDTASVGVDILEYIRIEKDGVRDLIQATKWEPYEISIVNIPANSKAKVGLEKEPKTELKQEKKEESKPMTLEEFQQNHPKLHQTVFSNGVTSENSRIKGIFAEVELSTTDLAKQTIQEKLFDTKSTVTDVEATLYREEKKQKEKLQADIQTDGKELADLTNEIGGNMQENSQKLSLHEKMMARKNGGKA